jgi:hypothetical protein
MVNTSTHWEKQYREKVPGAANSIARLLSRLEEFDGIANLDLSAEGTGFHLIAKLYPGVFQRVDLFRLLQQQPF